MKIFEGVCPVCHRNIRIPEMGEVRNPLYAPEDELKTEIVLLREALTDALFLIEEHGSPILKAHATRIMKIRRSLYGEGGLG